MSTQRDIRLWVNQTIKVNGEIMLEPKQSHYLSNVMRCSQGDTINCFNQNDGEYCAQITVINKNKTIITPLYQIAKTAQESDVWLIFAPLKKDKTDFVIEKAVELGASKIIPVITARTNVNQIKVERFNLQAIEAAEQCGRLSVPAIASPCDLQHLLARWNDKRILYFMDERQKGSNAAAMFKTFAGQPCAMLIGPEGGFSDEEADTLNHQPFVKNIQLGPRILRAETAALSALSVWQATAGDWQIKKE